MFKVEYPGVGTISLETPSEDLRPFFIRKYKTMFRFYCKGKDSVTKKDVETLADRVAEWGPADKKEATRKVTFDIIESVLLFGKDSNTEAEYLDNWLSTIYGDLQKKKAYAEKLQAFVPPSFAAVDLNQDGSIDMQEFKKWYRLRNKDPETAETVFHAVDADGDGTISVNEWGYGILTFFLTSGPDSKYSLWYGAIVD